MEVSLDEARDLLPVLAWTEVQWRKPGSGMHQHWYVIRDREVPVDLFWAIHRLIRREGHRGRYTTQDGRTMTNSYLDIGEWTYWSVPTRQLCRTRVEFGQHQRLPEQSELPIEGEDT